MTLKICLATLTTYLHINLVTARKMSSPTLIEPNLSGLFILTPTDIPKLTRKPSRLSSRLVFRT